jgi:hypothetical protein
MKNLIILLSYNLVACANITHTTFITPQSLMQPCEGVVHHDSNKLINVIDDIIENDRNHTICKEKLEQWQKLYNQYLKEFKDNNL